MEYELGKDCHLFHSFIGDYQPELIRLLINEHGRKPDYEKFLTFYNGGNSVEELEKSLGLDVREIMCCASKTDPAVVYHRPYGLILSGEAKVMFDNDSGLMMLPNGTYPTEPFFDFTHKVDLQTLMTTWYDQFLESPGLTWNEVVLKKGSKIVGAFYDPSYDSSWMACAGYCTFKEKEYSKFLEKVKNLGLDLLEIKSKVK